MHPSIHPFILLCSVGTIDGEHEIVPDHSPLPVRLAVEAAAGITAALAVSPLVSIIDKAITTNASGLEPLVPAVQNGLKTFFFQPIYFLKQPSFLFIWGVFSGTYAVANTVESIAGRSEIDPLYPKFLCSATTNVSLSVAKDYAFARMFGKGPIKPMPRTSLGIFATRDSMTILASFTLPPIIAGQLVNQMAFTPKNADITAQLIAPVSMQILSTPLHIFGLDLYNKARSDVKLSDRLLFIKQEYFKTLLARMSRIFPAFGIGGVLNKHLKRQGHEFIHKLYPYKSSQSLSLFSILEKHYTLK